MYFQHSAEIWRGYPQLVPGVLYVEGITHEACVDGVTENFVAIARARLAERAESELPEIQAWRRAFAKMGLKPTQYRCAAESLLRRLRKEGSLPQLHPLVELCNAVSVAFAVPIAVIDVAKVCEHVEVRYAAGDEQYLAFSGDVEHPEPGEVIFADRMGRAHARRWTNRQSGLSAVHEGTSSALIVAEAMHATALADMPNLLASIAAELEAAWSATATHVTLSASASRFVFA
jgi:DNA/RNA-binding domain of Phe-tRNA-synthetase-like protein